MFRERGKMNEEKILHLEDRYCLHSGSWTPVTVRIQKWHYHGPRVKLTLIEGFYDTPEDVEKALTKCMVNPQSLDNPKHFEIVCIPEGLLKLANALKEICEANV